MLEIDCYICGDELNEPGGLMFSPINAWSELEKNHICKRCWELVWDAYIVKLRKQLWRDKRKEK